MPGLKLTHEGIPVIDISAWLSPVHSDQDRTALLNELRYACCTYGFFQLVGHGVPVDLLDGVLKCGKRFFDLPLIEKMDVAMKHSMGHANRGYEVLQSQTSQEGTLPDLKEGFVVGPEVSASDPTAGRFLRGPNLWPSSLKSEDFMTPIRDYHDRLTQLAELLIEMLRLALPISVAEDVFDDFMHQPSANLRLLHYPPQACKDERQFGVGAHTDLGAITLNLQQCGTSGLEVWYPPTSKWIPVSPERGAFVVNIGNMLQLWTCGYYRSALHRVINATTSPRFSAPFLYNGNMESFVTPIVALQQYTCAKTSSAIQVVSVEERFRDWLAKTRK